MIHENRRLRRQFFTYSNILPTKIISKISGDWPSHFSDRTNLPVSHTVQNAVYSGKNVAMFIKLCQRNPPDVTGKSPDLPGRVHLTQTRGEICMHGTGVQYLVLDSGDTFYYCKHIIEVLIAKFAFQCAVARLEIEQTHYILKLMSLLAVCGKSAITSHGFLAKFI